MRKIKKINGFLVVRFNDREKRNYPDLGSFGVIDAEQYTGDIDFDRDAMEYTDADCIEVAVEQARGLESESDFSEEPPVCTVIVESDAECSEEEVEPQLMIAEWEQQLKTQVESKHYPDIDAKAAAHELHGFKVALYRLGMIGKSETDVDPDRFAPAVGRGPLPQNPEEMLAYICDNICKQRIPGRTDEQLDAICEECAVDRLYQEAESRQLRARETALSELNALIAQFNESTLSMTSNCLRFGASQYLRALQVVGFLTEKEVVDFDAQIWHGSPGDDNGPYHPGKPELCPYRAGALAKGETE